MGCILVHDNNISDIHAYQQVHIVLQFGKRKIKSKMTTCPDDFPGDRRICYTELEKNNILIQLTDPNQAAPIVSEMSTDTKSTVFTFGCARICLKFQDMKMPKLLKCTVYTSERKQLHVHRDTQITTKDGTKFKE